MTWSELIKRDSTSEHDVEVAFAAGVPGEVFDFLRRTVQPTLATKKIEGIKAIRGEFGIGLMAAKTIVDVMQRGCLPVKGRVVTPEMIDSIEAVETACRKAIRKAHGDERAVAALTAIRHQVAELWDDLVLGDN